jgi:hypothetical protein
MRQLQSLMASAPIHEVSGQADTQQPAAGHRHLLQAGLETAFTLDRPLRHEDGGAAQIPAGGKAL